MSGPFDRSAWDRLDSTLMVLRGCGPAAELVECACELALRGCGADAAAIGRVRDGVWTPWLRAGRPELLESLGSDGTLPSEPVSLEKPASEVEPTDREVTLLAQALVVARVRGREVVHPVRNCVDDRRGRELVRKEEPRGEPRAVLHRDPDVSMLHARWILEPLYDRRAWISE